MNPKYIFSAVLAVCLLMGLLLPNMARPVSAVPVSAPASAPASASESASTAPSPAAEVDSGVGAGADTGPAPGAAAAFASGLDPAPSSQMVVAVAPTAIPAAPTAMPTLPPNPAPLENNARVQAAAPIFNPPPQGMPSPTPLTASPQVIPLTAASQPDLDRFAASLINNNSHQITGVYVPGLFALPVVNQPGGEEAYVSGEDQTLTQYATPARFGTIGLLAHNYLSGKTFFRLKQGQIVAVIYGDGRKAYFEVTGMQSYQAISPHDPRSDFVDLTDPTYRLLNYTQVFDRVYTNAGQLVFQTCIEANGELSWGRLFVLASPVSPPQGFSN